MVNAKLIPLSFGSNPGSLPLQYQCEVQRSQRKTLAIHIKYEKIEVRAPVQASPRDIKQFLELHQEWIERRLCEESKRHQEILCLQHGKKIFYRAQEVDIVFRQGRKERLLRDNGQLIFQAHQIDEKKAKQMLARFLQDKASEYLPFRTRALAKHLNVDHKLNDIRFRKTKSKWGHCTSTGLIQFNWLIMLAPFSIIDYMITHEVCHLKHMDHSKRYWKLVESVCPDYKRYVNWLQEHEHRLWF